MSPDSPNSPDHRAQPREPHKGAVSIRLGQAALSGVSENLSAEGIMFYTEEDLRVTVEFEGPQGPCKRSGRIVRVNRVGEKETGMAVEFDPE